MYRNKKSASIPAKYIGVAVVILALIGFGYYQYVKENNSLPTSAVVTIGFADGTTKSFDSSTMALGALYNPDTSAPVSYITYLIKIKPVVQAPDGSQPTSLPSGYSLVSRSTSNVGITVRPGTGSEFYWKDLTKAIPTGSALVPNTDNVILTGTMAASELDALPQVSSLPSDNTVKVYYKLESLNDVTNVALIKPDGTTTELNAGTSSATFLYDSMVVLKKTSTSTSSGTATIYTLQGVTISGSSGLPPPGWSP